MKKILLLVGNLILFCSFLYSDDTVQASLVENDSVSFIFSGDIMGHSPQFQAAYNPQTNRYDYNVCFQEVKPYIENADFAVANLEVPIAGKPYSGYPNFSSPDALLDGLKYAGYDVLLTANNHVLDKGKFGLERTIHQIDKRKMLHEGSYIDNFQRDSTYPLIIESKGLKIALLNCTYGTNARVVTFPNYVNYIDTLEILKDIQKANDSAVDFKIMILHWGTEYELQANDFQRNIAKFLVYHGINLIIGSHPHVVQNAETFYTKDSIAVPVFYSLGNSISNQRQLNTDGGIMLKVAIDVNTKTLKSASYLPVYVFKGILNGKYQYHLIPTTEYLSHPKVFNLPASDSTSLVLFDKLTRDRLSNVLIYKQQ
ncbi:MAG: CapA family protein [Paludibacter sp.]|jgi:poly-gamma-glutamate synthesis protein (capsule biosynthesis protein)